MNTQEIKVEKLSFALKNKTILDNISIDIKRGELLGIVGPNGAGKTTFLKNLCNIHAPGGGTVTLDGKRISAFSPVELSKRICYLPQNINFNFPFKVSEIVLMGRYPYLKRMENEGKKDYEIAKSSLIMVDMLDFIERDILTLSGGEQQRVSLSRVIAQDTDFLLLDEPLSNLDINHQLSTMNLLKSLSRKGKGVVVVLHDLRLAYRYCTKLAVLNHGILVDQGSPAMVLNEQLISSVFKVKSAMIKDYAQNDSIDLIEPLDF